MKNFWTSFKAFLNSPLKFVQDPANTVIAYQVKLMESEGRTMAEIDQALTEEGMIKGEHPVVTSVKHLATGVVDGLDFILKNLPVILVLAVAIVIGWYVLMFRKASG